MSDYMGLNLELDDFSRLLNQEELVEEPVPLEVFVQDKRYLNLPFLSEIQTEIVKQSTQIYRKDTLQKLMGDEAGTEYYDKYTQNEVICQLGKGSGKDHCSRIAMARTVYLLHCLRDPLGYYGKATGVYVDLLNLAVNAQQAQRVFFEPLKNLLLASPWFNDQGFEPRVSEIFFFSRPVRCFSGHSESEGWEGYEVLTVVLDEISAFKTDSELKGEIRNKGSASAIYNMSKLSVMSRFPEVGKVILLSFPRYKGDFIQQRYEGAIEKSEPKTWCIKASTWDVNPTIKRHQLESEYIRNPVEAAARFECEPPHMEDAYFRDAELVRKAFMYHDDPIGDDGSFHKWFNGEDSKARYIHVDLGLKRDRAALSMVHGAGFTEIKTSMGTELLPIINVDLVYYWEAVPGKEINFASVRQMILDLNRKFELASVTFDQWQSVDMIQTLRSLGVPADLHSVKKTDYDTLMTSIYDRRLRGYWSELLVEDELLKLRLINNNKLDHPTKGTKDLADSLAGAVFACAKNITLDTEVEIEIVNTGPSIDEKYEYDRDPTEVLMMDENSLEWEEINSQTRVMPNELKDWLGVV